MITLWCNHYISVHYTLKKTLFYRVPSSVNVDKRNTNIGITELKVKSNYYIFCDKATLQCSLQYQSQLVCNYDEFYKTMPYKNIFWLISLHFRMFYVNWNVSFYLSLIFFLVFPYLLSFWSNFEAKLFYNKENFYMHPLHRPTGCSSLSGHQAGQWACGEILDRD